MIPEKVKYIQNQILTSFSSLKFFEKTHEYFVDGKQLESVSNVIKRFYEPFNADKQSVSSAKKTGQSAAELKAKWEKAGKDACDLGHRVHYFGECRYHDKEVKPMDGFELAICKWWDSLPSYIFPVLCETQVFNKNLTFSGTFDLLLYDLKHDGLIIADYKTNKDLFKNYMGKKMKDPFSFLLDNPYNHYQIQQSLYQIPLMEIGLNVIDRWLIHLIPDKKNPLEGNYKQYELLDFSNHLINIV